MKSYLSYPTHPMKFSNFIKIVLSASKIATGVFLIFTFVLLQTAFAISSSTNFKIYGQVNSIVGSPTSVQYMLDVGAQPIAGESSSVSYDVQQGSIFGREEGIAAPVPTGSPLPLPTTPGTGSPLPAVGGAEPAPEIEILNLEFTEVTPDRVKVVFDTDDLAVAHFQYGEEDTLLESLLESALKLRHEFILEGLTPGTTYKFIIKLRDVYLNLTEAGEFIFTTPSLNYKYFIDVQDDQWFAPYVNALVTAGCLSTEGGYYYPADDLTRAHAVKLLVCAGGLEAGVPGHPTFTDVSLGHWAYPYVEIAYTHGVIDGYSGDQTGYFGPDDPITREQFAKMVTETFNLPIMTVCNMFGDSNAIGDWACEFVGTAYAWSIVDGYPDGTYGPGRHINRAEGAKMIANGANPVLRAGIDITETEGGAIGEGIDIDVEAEAVEGVIGEGIVGEEIVEGEEEGVIGEGIVGDEIVEGEEDGVIGEGLDVGDVPVDITPTPAPTPPVSDEEIIEIEIEIGPGGDLDYGLTDGSIGDSDDLSDVMEYLLDALQKALEGQ